MGPSVSDLYSISCWCGLGELAHFSQYYRRCTSCNTLVSTVRNTDDFYKGGDSGTDLYGKEYWTSHVKTLGFPDIYERSRADLTERSLYWLRSILKYKLPPAKTLELGCAHGGSVYLQRLAGYDAVGAEMSHWLCEYAKSTFDVPMLCGGIEDIGVGKSSLDIVVLMDVLEHFTYPEKSLSYIVDTLSEDGFAVIQTPVMRSIGKTYEQMQSDNEMFLLHMKQDEHLYLFNQESITKLLTRVGLPHISFEPAIFGYDMFVFAGKRPLTINSQKIIEKYLTSTPMRRTVLALLDLYAMWEKSTHELHDCRLSNDNLTQINSDSVRRADDMVKKINDCSKISQELNDIKSSVSWQSTKPLRIICDKLRKLIR